MKNLLAEFKAFALKGNVVEIAIGLVLAIAFGAVVASLVDDVLMQVIAAIFGQPNFSSLVIDLGDATIRYGSFLNTLITFALVALALFFFVVRPTTHSALDRIRATPLRRRHPQISLCCARSGTPS